MMVSMEGRINVVELFAGVGGFRKGLEQASDRFITLWANQWEPRYKKQFAFDCYNRHFHDTESINVNQDIGTVKELIPWNFDLLVGGFPCQDYSVASSNAKGIEGRKGVLWWHIRDVIESRRPKYVLLENVDRLLKSPSNQRGRDFGIILRCLSDLGYGVEWRVINAADYGFVQKRRRTFIFACRNDTAHYRMMYAAEPEDVILIKGFFSREFPAKAMDANDSVDMIDLDSEKYSDLVFMSNNFKGRFLNAGYMISSKAFTREIISNYSGKTQILKDILEENVSDEYYQDANIGKWKEMKSSKKLIRVNSETGISYLYSEGAIPFPDRLESPGRTMLTSEGSKNRSSHLILDPATNRYRILTPVECERMNGFPDGWTEGMSKRQRYFTMGNALVVGLIEKMGRCILNADDENNL